MFMGFVTHEISFLFKKKKRKCWVSFDAEFKVKFATETKADQ